MHPLVAGQVPQIATWLGAPHAVAVTRSDRRLPPRMGV